MSKSILAAAMIALAAILWIGSSVVFPARKPADEAPQSAGTQAGQATVKVKVEALTARSMQRNLVIQGRTVPFRDVTLKAEIDAQVLDVVPAKGERVAEGEPLIRLDMRDRLARRSEAEALVAQRLLQFRQAEQLASREFASRSKLAEARAVLESARAALESAREGVSNTTIVAPFAGVFDENLVETGSFVKNGEAVARLIQLDPMKVIAEVSERDVAVVSTGRPAVVQLVDGQKLGAAVTWISRAADPQTRTYRVELSVPNPAGQIPGGMTAEVQLGLDTVEAHLVSPAVLTLSDKGEIGVKTVDNGNLVQFHPVQIASDGPDGVWLTGLPAQVRLITVGQDYVVVGQSVQATPAEPAETTPVGDESP